MAGKPSDADLIPLPNIPKPKKEDPEDVAWALSTAEAMWNRAENADAIKWIRRAAEAASEAEADDRALELAKAAADLASMLVRVENAPSASSTPTASSAPAAPNGPRPTMIGHPPAPAASTPPKPPSATPPKPPSATPPPPPSASTGSFRPPSNVPAKPSSLPSAAATPSPARASGKPPSPARAAPPQAALPKVSGRGEKRGRRSSHNLNEEAKRSAAAQIAARAGGEGEVTREITAVPVVKRASPASERKRRSRPDPAEAAPAAAPSAPQVDEAPVPTSPGGADTTAQRRVTHTDEMDQWPTQALSNQELSTFDDQRTRIGAAAYAPEAQERVLGGRSAELRASQAVRVVVWRGPDGVHVAPAGTTVSAITVDALLVALDADADLAAWLKG